MKRFYIARLSHLDSPPRAASSGTAPRVPRWMERRAKAFPGRRKARPPACPLSRQSVPRMAGVGGGSPSRSVLPHVPSPAGSVLPYSGREAPFFPEILSNSWPDGSWLSCLQCVSCPGPAGLRDARPPHSLSPEQALRPWRKWTRSAPQQSGPAPVRTALSADLGQESRQKTHRGVTSLGEPVRASVHHFTVCEDAFSPERYFHSLSCLPPSVLITNRMKNRQTPPNKAKPPPV